MIKLYHYSNNNIKGKISIKYFADNSFTTHDKNICNINRIYFYTDINNIEYFFKNSKYTYIINVNEKSLYNFDTDIKHLKNKYNSIHELLCYCKKHYQGIIYSIGLLKIAVLFNDVKYNYKIKNNNKKWR
jgi:hypothetical protein